MPCLLHAYWALHALHLVLGAIALHTWWKAAALKLQLSTSTGALSVRPPSTADLSLETIYRLLPWVFLGLIFWIPGIYLEWPSDPWEHLRRINEWHILDQVMAHSSWKKSSYFLPYSLTGHTTGLVQLSWLNYYSTAACLLLCWQYYRLARAVGFGERASFIFILLNALTFGNNVFSFYRYYGLSSSIFAQLGAVALTRIALEALLVQGGKAGDRESETRIHCLASHRLGEGWIVFRDLLVRGPAVGALIALTALNHLQGLGIAALGVLAVVVWRLIEWKRVTIFWLAAASVALSIATIVWFPRNPALDEFYRPQGWLTPWYGFNFFLPSSPVVDRSLHILGAFGVLNLILGVWLIAQKNHIAGWLTLMPVVALALPCFALPFSHVVAANTSPGNIVTFHRMLLAVPMGLALVAAFCPKNREEAARRQETGGWKLATSNRLPAVRGSWSLALILLILLAVTVTPGKSGYNRFWHSILNTPDDLQLIHHMTGWKPAPPARTEDRDILKIDTPLGHEIQQVFFLSDSASWEHLRLIDVPLFSATLDHRLRDLGAIIHLFNPTPLNTDSVRSDQLTFNRPAITPQKITAAPTSANQHWIALGGVPPLHTYANGQLTVSNPIGNDSVAFNQDLIPISPYKRYRLTSRVRQTGSTTATNFLAVAWYDRDMRLLQSLLMQPQGAGVPRGWNNSTYSYYGLVDQPASTTWAHYSINLGLGETASIPANAYYLRIGALLNYHATPEAKVEITDVTLIENPIQSHLLITAPGFQHLYTPASQAALLSGHWSAQYVATAHAGTEELRSTAINF